jgi:hypothetical protein
MIQYWFSGYDPTLTTLPRFESKLLSLYEEKDSKYKLLNRNKKYSLIGTNIIRSLSAPELMYLKKQLEDNVECKSKLKKIEMICKKK